VLWFRGEEELRNSEGHSSLRIIDTYGQSELSFECVLSSDENEYSVFVFDQHGSEVCSTELTVYQGSSYLRVIRCFFEHFFNELDGSFLLNFAFSEWIFSLCDFYVAFFYKSIYDA